ncbi:hypothetical protein DFJ74DRAFT_674090 [Hyaloraphidium curvatum]|nr:hypothetical protein DFJ74DRAFT_674090 [Hyaloraphidium curvatum]
MRSNAKTGREILAILTREVPRGAVRSATAGSAAARPAAYKSPRPPPTRIANAHPKMRFATAAFAIAAALAAPAAAAPHRRQPPPVPPYWTFVNGTDPATGNPACRANYNTGSFTGSGQPPKWEFCPAPCGPDIIPGVTQVNGTLEPCPPGETNGLQPQDFRYYLNFTIRASPPTASGICNVNNIDACGSCEMDQVSSLSAAAPITKGSYTDMNCGLIGPCAWDALQQNFGAVVQQSGQYNFTTVQLNGTAPLPQNTWCALGMGCPRLVIDNTSTFYGSTVPDPRGTRFQCPLYGTNATTDTLIRLDEIGNPLCAVAKQGDTECLEMPMACCFSASNSYSPQVPIPTAPCKGSAADPDRCTRAKTYFSDGTWYNGTAGPNAAVLGFNCTYLGPTGPTTGSSPWVVATGPIPVDPFTSLGPLNNGTGYFIVRQEPGGGLSCLADGGACVNMTSSICANNAAATAPLNAVSKDASGQGIVVPDGLTTITAGTTATVAPTSSAATSFVTTSAFVTTTNVPTPATTTAPSPSPATSFSAASTSSAASSAATSTATPSATTSRPSSAGRISGPGAAAALAVIAAVLAF